MAEWIARGIIYRSVFELSRIKSFAGILDPIDDRAFEADAKDFDIFRRVELSTVFDRVVEHLAESICDRFARIFRNIGLELDKQFLQDLHGRKITWHPQLNPVWFGGN